MEFTYYFWLILTATLFIGVSAVHLVACYRRYPKIRTVTKVLLMPLLCALYAVSAPQIRLLVIVALLFGWLGDVFLLFKNSRLLMLCGICAFALGHIFYIGAMLSDHPSVHILIFVPVLLCALWLTFVYKKLLPYAPKSLRKPGFVYALLLSGTGLTALYLLLTTQRIPYLVAFIGGLFFMLSDTILTGQQYRRETKHGNFYVMLTYIAAQTLLIAGFVLLGGN